MTPVISDFDPQFNQDSPVWFERLFEPFKERQQEYEQQGYEELGQ